jgi:hypothetical protein
MAAPTLFGVHVSMSAWANRVCTPAQSAYIEHHPLLPEVSNCSATGSFKGLGLCLSVHAILDSGLSRRSFGFFCMRWAVTSEEVRRGIHDSQIHTRSARTDERI